MANEKDTIRVSINFVTVAHMIMDRPKWVSQQIKQIRSIINRIERLPNELATPRNQNINETEKQTAATKRDNENWSDIKCQMDKSISETKRKKIVNKIEEWKKKQV